MDGARGVLLSIAGPSTMSLHEATTAAQVVADHADDEAEIIFGALVDDELGEEIKVTVIAAGFDKGRPARRPSTQGTTTRPSERVQPPSTSDDDLDIPSFVQG